MRSRLNFFNLLCAFNYLQPMKKFVFSVASRATGRLQIKPSGSGDENVSRRVSSRVRTHEKNSGETVRRLGIVVQSMFCSQSGAGIRLNFWKSSGESRYPGALSPFLEKLRPAFSPDQTNCPWVSEDAFSYNSFQFEHVCPWNYLRKETPLKSIKFVLENLSF